MTNKKTSKIKRELPNEKTLKTLIPGYLKRLKKLSRYAQEGIALDKLFKETYPKNKDINEILIKVVALDSCYSTNVRRFSSINKVAEAIKNIKDFDRRVQKTGDNFDAALVDEICAFAENDEEKLGRPFSFATKYCCNHNIEYPIYDSFVAKVLTYYQNKFYFLGTKDKISPEKLSKSYANDFYPTIKKFKEHYGFENYTFRELDHFLWLLGKEYLGEGVPDEVEEVSIKVGVYVIVIEEWDSVSIYKQCEDTIKALNKCAESVNYDRPENISDIEFANNLIKDYCGSENRTSYAIGEYYVEVINGNKVNVYFKEENAKDAMRIINGDYSFGFKDDFNTRRNGKKLVNYFKKKYDNAEM